MVIVLGAIRFFVAFAKSVTLLTALVNVGKNGSAKDAVNLPSASNILLTAPVNVFDILSALPAIPMEGDSNAPINASLNSGNVILLKSSIPLKDLIMLSTPFSRKMSAAPAPPA